MKTEIYWAPNPPDGMIAVTHPTRDVLLADIDRLMVARQGFTLATLNLDHCVKIRRDSAFHAAYLAHSHVVADGNPIVWLSRLAGYRVSLVPGSELVMPLAALAAARDLPVALFGATTDTLAAAAAALEAAHPGLHVVARVAPPFGFDPTGPVADNLIVELGQSGARLFFLALGAPKQERFAVRAAAVLPGCGFASIGAGLDFIAGTQRRAPRLAQNLSLEWLWRLLGNPGRLAGRYAACFAILPGLTWAARRQRARDL